MERCMFCGGRPDCAGGRGSRKCRCGWLVETRAMRMVSFCGWVHVSLVVLLGGFLLGMWLWEVWG